MSRRRYPALLFTAALLSGCAVVNQTYLNKKYGNPDPAARSRQARHITGIDYWTQVKPILNNRCVVCHACYDSPCQFNLTSYDGLERGGSKQNVYDTGRLFESPPTRLGVDAQSTEEWRRKGFHAVLNERTQNPEFNLDASVFAKMLALKETPPPERTRSARQL